MKPFRFKQFEVVQSEKIFRVGTDAVLLGALCHVKNPKKILEVGCGSGIISLMLAQRFQNSQITAIDINPEAAELSQENFKNSKFNTRLNALFADYKTFSSSEKWEAIVCNPPFFEENSSIKDVVARQKRMLTFTDLIQKTNELISDNGIFSVILPTESEEIFVQIAKNHQLNLIKKINIFGIENGVLKRNILEFSKQKNKTETQNFTIEKSPRKYSDEYLEATKDFHIFNLK